MKLFLLCIASSVLLFCTVTAEAGIYAGLHLGIAIPDDTELIDEGNRFDVSLDSAFHSSGVIGYEFTALPVRIEGEISYNENDTGRITTPSGAKFDTDGYLESTSFMVNFLYDFKNESSFTPYLSAGLGYSMLELKFNDTGNQAAEDDVFAWSVGAGIAYSLTESLFFDLQYKYFATADAEDTPTNLTDPSIVFDVEYDYSAHIATLGVRYHF
ncbi:MAG: outer membrane beta-barrel protein [Desulforhopalus sp.]